MPPYLSDMRDRFRRIETENQSITTSLPQSETYTKQVIIQICINFVVKNIFKNANKILTKILIQSTDTIGKCRLICPERGVTKSRIGKRN